MRSSWKNCPLLRQPLDDLVTTEALSHFETGLAQPSMRMATRLAGALRVSLDALQEPCFTELPRQIVQDLHCLEVEKLFSHLEVTEMLDDPEDVAPSAAMIALMQAAGRNATETARAELRAKGITPVFWRDGHVVEETSDQEEPLHPIALTGSDDFAHWEVWCAAGEAATAEAHCRLKAQGIGVVAKREGIVIEELPDGTVHPLLNF